MVALTRDEAMPAANVYFNEVLIELNMVFRLLPSPLTTAMIASVIPAAISPYSMAVAPDSSDENFTKLRFNSASSALFVSTGCLSSHGFRISRDDVDVTSVSTGAHQLTEMEPWSSIPVASFIPQRSD